MRQTSAWPLSHIYLALIVYASLYPFDQWRDQGIFTWEFLSAPWPKYWTGFDVTSNVLGYAPLGFLWGLSAMRMGWGRRAIVVAGDISQEATMDTLVAETLKTLICGSFTLLE